MKKDKKAKTRFFSLAIGELAFFVLAWMLSIAAALNGQRSHSSPGDDIAASSSYSNMIDVLE